ncbi:Rpn family recombination-promoting nuclease/putative transposase [Leptolyngbya sp. Cla-17]|uniref:Rpn family recombination-promoting nuclease/putative transposase n=1 Tax=Leptolyngbya sp. Cla-17 TaxID=2803751 RepID=UPI0039F4D19D
MKISVFGGVIAPYKDSKSLTSSWYNRTMFDNVSKFLVEQYSADFASWLVGEPIALTELSPSELSLEPIRADALILLQSADVVLHCEFQTDPDSTMPFRMADYALRVFRRFPQKRLVQVVIYLRPTDSELVQQNTFTANRLYHEFQVVRLWEQPTEFFFQRPGLLPYAVLSQTSDRSSVLREVAEAIDALQGRQQQSNLAAATGILAGLVLDKQMIRRLLRRELMQESVIYQELRKEAREEVRQEERLKGEQLLILEQLTNLFIELPQNIQDAIAYLPSDRLKALSLALLRFKSLEDFEQWLKENAG